MSLLFSKHCSHKSCVDALRILRKLACDEESHRQSTWRRCCGKEWEDSFTQIQRIEKAREARGLLRKFGTTQLPGKCRRTDAEEVP